MQNDTTMPTENKRQITNIKIQLLLSIHLMNWKYVYTCNIEVDDFRPGRPIMYKYSIVVIDNSRRKITLWYVKTKTFTRCNVQIKYEKTRLLKHYI